MQAKFNKFTTWVPDEWLDQSTITFCMPASTELDAPLSGGKSQAQSAANFVVTWEQSKGQSLALYGKERLAKLKDSLPGFKLLEEGIKSSDGEETFYAEYHILMTPPLTQLVQIKNIDGDFVCLTGTAIQNVYPEVKEQFKKSMQALKLNN